MDTDLADVRIGWLDVESTGIDPYNGEMLLQVAAIVTDGHLNELAEGFMVKIHYTEDEVAQMKAASVPFVQEMHEKTNLWGTLPTEGVPLAEAEDALLAYLDEHVGERGVARLGGNSITLDRNFMTVFMPRAHAYFHYRSYDMTSVAGFFQLYRPEIPLYEKQSTHDALDDIRESVEEARYYADLLSNEGGPVFAE